MATEPHEIAPFANLSRLLTTQQHSQRFCKLLITIHAPYTVRFQQRSAKSREFGGRLQQDSSYMYFWSTVLAKLGMAIRQKRETIGPFRNRRRRSQHR